MFTGIVEEIGKITSAQPRKLVISAREVLQEMEVGGSIAVNGVCLTVTSFNDNSFSVDIMVETLKRTNLGLLGAEDKVNLERPLMLGKPLGGHLVQGHVDDTGRVISVTRHGETSLVSFETSAQVMRYVVEKGFIAIDGVSLTVVAKDTRSFQVSLVRFTQEHSILGKWRQGSLVNLEVDVIAKYVEQLNQSHNSGLTIDFLQKHGFLVT